MSQHLHQRFKPLPRAIQRQIDDFKSAYDEAMHDPIILARLEHLSLLLAPSLKRTFSPTNRQGVEELRRSLHDRVDDIDLAWDLAIEAIYDRAPRLAYYLNEAVPWQVGETVYYWITGERLPVKPPDIPISMPILPFGNPIFLDSSRTLHGWELASLEHFQQLIEFREAFRHPRPVGRPRRPAQFNSAQQALEVVINLTRLSDRKGLPPTQPRIAEWLKMRLDSMSAAEGEPDNTIGALLTRMSAKRVDRDTRSVVRFIQRLCKHLNMSWDDVVRLARTPQ